MMINIFISVILLFLLIYWGIVDLQYYISFMYKTVIQNFYRLYLIYSFYKVLVIFPMLYNISL